MKKSNFFHYRHIKQDDGQYGLGRSNSTALSKGGITIGVFLAKEGEIHYSSDPSDANQIAWAFTVCSNKDNYGRSKGRSSIYYKIQNEKQHIIFSKNYDYDVVKKIADKFADVIHTAWSKSLRGYMDEVKTFSIDAWVDAGFQSKDAVIEAPVLMMKNNN